MNDTAKPRRVVFFVTAPMTARLFLTGILERMSEEGDDVHLITGGSGAEGLARGCGATPHCVEMTRAPGLGDFRAFIGVLFLLWRLRPGLIVCGTPKASLMGLVAALLLRVPRRVYVLHGLRLEGSRGLHRRCLWLAEALTFLCATSSVAVSHSLRTAAIASSLPRSSRLVVLGEGSANGIDILRFVPNSEAGKNLRVALGISHDARVVGFVGRLTSDKGIGMMHTVFSRLLQTDPKSHLILVGPEESSSEDARAEVSALKQLDRVTTLGERHDLEQVYPLFDALVLFTRREGLPTVVLEAAACGVPTVATRATGTIDAVVHGDTGYLVEQDDAVDAIRWLERILGDPVAQYRLGQLGRARVMSYFSREHVVEAWCKHLSRGVADAPHVSSGGR